MYTDQLKAVDEYDLSSLKLIISAAAAVPQSLSEKVRTRLEPRWNSSVCITQAYGLSEVSGLSHYLSEADVSSHPGSIGKLIPIFEAKIVAEGKAISTINERGELWLRGPAVMKV
jgi:long-subunit acyl-CoA synthetase (AMP-forming)